MCSLCEICKQGVTSIYTFFLHTNYGAHLLEERFETFLVPFAQWAHSGSFDGEGF